jgi:hypothetical protein
MANHYVEKREHNRIVFSVPRTREYSSDYRADYTDEYVLNLIPFDRNDLHSMDDVEVEVTRYKEKVAEEQRVFKVRQDALAKLKTALTDEERKVLGL